MDFSMMFDVISLACGIYLLVTWSKLRIAGRLFPNSLLVPRDKTVKDCRDPTGYIHYISPRLLTVGIVIVLSGLLGLFNSYFQFYGFWAAEGIVAVALAALIWYAVCSMKANKRFW